MPCVELVERITDYLESVLDGDTVRRIQDHLRICAGCEEYLNEVRLALRVMDDVSAEPLSADLESNLLAIYRGWSAESAVA